MRSTNEELQQHGSAGVGLPTYLVSGDFLSPMFSRIGKRILADVGLRDADGDAISARLGGVT